MLVKDISNGYKALGAAKVTSLSEEEILKVVKARKALKPHAESYDAFMDDLREKMKPEGFDEIQKKIQTQEKLSSQELSILYDYDKKVLSASKEEREKDLEVAIEKLDNKVSAKIIKENGWTFDELEALSFLF